MGTIFGIFLGFGTTKNVISDRQSYPVQLENVWDKKILLGKNKNDFEPNPDPKNSPKRHNPEGPKKVQKRPLQK